MEKISGKLAELEDGLRICYAGVMCMLLVFEVLLFWIFEQIRTVVFDIRHG